MISAAACRPLLRASARRPPALDPVAAAVRCVRLRPLATAAGLADPPTPRGDVVGVGSRPRRGPWRHRLHHCSAVDASAARRGFASTAPPSSADGKIVRFSRLRPRQAAELEDELTERLAEMDGDERLMDPVLGRSITRRGLDWVGSVTVPSSLTCSGGEDSEVDECITATLRPTTLLHPKLHELSQSLSDVVRREMAELIRERPGWFENSDISAEDIAVRVDVRPQPASPAASRSSGRASELLHRGPALESIRHFLAVYSCKGGVGKSTIAANLAYELSSRGARVGLLDADVYGPSLPLLVRPDDPAVRKSEKGNGKMVEPIAHGGVKLMSLGYVSPDSGVPGSGPGGGAAVLRGPMAGRVVSQLLRGTDWGDLDVLVLDLPPGTGDVQLEVCQSLSLSGAVAVSTPSSLAWADVTSKSLSTFMRVSLVHCSYSFLCTDT